MISGIPGKDRGKRRLKLVAGLVGALLIVAATWFKNGASITEGRSWAAASSANPYFPTLPPGATLPTESQCAAEILATPETIPANAPFNRTTVTRAQLDAFAARGYSFESLTDKAQYRRITGDYIGSTDMIMRWAACKYGIDENVVRGQAWDESWWQQARTGDRRNSRSQCVQGNFDGLWDTTIDLTNGESVACPNCCWTSWSAWQTKVYYEWMAWPMIKDSTSFAAEYRYASTRACLDGAWRPYYASRSAFPGHSTYSDDLAGYTRDPSSANLDRILWGCVGSHYSGEWYDPGAVKYIADIQTDIAHRRWLTPQLHVTGVP